MKIEVSQRRYSNSRPPMLKVGRVTTMLIKHSGNTDEPENEIFHDCEVVIFLGRVNDFFSQKCIFSGVFVEQAPVHLDVPRIRVQ